MKDNEARENQIQFIPIEDITVLNPRSRGGKEFHDIIRSVQTVGLKRPITVTPYRCGKFNLVCGQGRLEVYRELGQTNIPAHVIKASEKQAILMSLVENIARRRHSAIDLLNGVNELVERGFSVSAISKKVGLDTSYLRGIIKLLRKGEERLVSSVEKGQMPLDIAIKIVETSGDDLQQAISDAYQNNLLRGKKLIMARRVIQIRQCRGKKFNRNRTSKSAKNTTAKNLVDAYKQETKKQKLLIQRAKKTEHQLLFIESALRNLFSDENFRTVVNSEGLGDAPSFIFEGVKEEGGHNE
ncbi:MAG: plasmid partitioning protein RepB C-terminal domain-containing protein [Pseudomonadota bacterium]